MIYRKWRCEGCKKWHEIPGAPEPALNLRENDISEDDVDLESLRDLQSHNDKRTRNITQMLTGEER